MTDKHEWQTRLTQRENKTLKSHQKLANALTQAIRSNDPARLHAYLKTIAEPPSLINSLLALPTRQGASAKQWALWIQNNAVLSQLGIPANGQLQVFDQVQATTLDATASQRRFHFSLMDSPRFESPSTISWVIAYLRCLFRWHFFQDSCLWYAAHFKDYLNQPPLPHFLVHYIDNTLGYGVMTERRINVGEYVGEYVGDINLRHIFSPRRDTTYIIDYPIPMPPGYRWSIDAKLRGNFTRFINHSSDANCKVEVAYDGYIFRLLILAKKKIRPGEELRLNYGKDYWRHRSAIKKMPSD